MSTFPSTELISRLYGQFDGTFAWDFLPYEPGTAALDGEPQLTEVDEQADRYFQELPTEVARLKLDKLIEGTESKGGGQD